MTTIIDMPLNSIPPTTTLEGLAEKRAAALETGVKCDVGFWGGIVPGNADQLVPLLEQGVKGFKCFLINSGVDEFRHVEEPDLVIACDALTAANTNALVLFHAELEKHAHEGAEPSHESPDAYSTFLASRPESLETDALALILSLARRYPSLRFHIVHLSAAEALPAIRAARSGADGGSPVANLTVETCFHYLTLRAEDIPANATQFKCCPPIRDETNRLAIVDAVLDGTIDFVVSDHSPCTPELKKGDFMSAWGGISGLGFGLPLLHTQLAGRVTLPRLVHLLATAQARQVGLDKTKGSIQVGGDADLVIFDPTTEYSLSEHDLFFKNKLSPYLGRKLVGRVERTILRGEAVYVADKGHMGVSGVLV